MSEIVRFRHRHAHARPWPAPAAMLLTAAIIAGGAIGYFAQDLGVLRLGWGGDFALCVQRDQQNCVVDGDTIRYDGQTIRLADIDAPETREPKCTSEAMLGARATRRLIELINDGPFEVVAARGRDADRYGRKLRTLERYGQSLGDVLVAEGLARRMDGARRNWCS